MDIKNELNEAYKLLSLLTVSGDAVDIVAAVRSKLRKVAAELQEQEPEKEEQ